MKVFRILFLFFLFLDSIVLSKEFVEKTDLGEELNSIYMVVGKRAITTLELKKVSRLAALISKMENRNITAEDFLIEKVIVEQVAEEDSIIVSEEKLRNEIQKRKTLSNIKTDEEFKKNIEKETGLPFELWKEVLKYQILKQQIIQIRIPIPQPTEKEIENFYQKNRKKLGIEVLYREIIFPRTYSIKQEKKIYAIAKRVHQQLQSNPARFSEIAKTLPENISPYKYGGGIRLWTPISEIARQDSFIAGVVYNLRAGKISPIFRNRKGQYVIVKVEGKRNIPLSKVRELIRIRLFYEKAEKAFQNWVQQKKKDLIIKKIYAGS